MRKQFSILTLLSALTFSIFLLTSCLPGPEVTTATSSPTTSEAATTVTELTIQTTVAATETTTATTQIETTEPTTSATTSATTASTATTNGIHALTGTFQSYVWGDFLHVDILGDDGVLYSFFVINCDSEVEIETLTSGQKVIVTWQNIDKELPIGDTTEIHNIDELLTLVLADE